MYTCVIIVTNMTLAFDFRRIPACRARNTAQHALVVPKVGSTRRIPFGSDGHAHAHTEPCAAPTADTCCCAHGESRCSASHPSASMAVAIMAGDNRRYWTWLSHFFLWGSILLWFVFVIIYTMVKPGFTGHLDDKDNIYGIV